MQQKTIDKLEKARKTFLESLPSTLSEIKSLWHRIKLGKEVADDFPQFLSLCHRLSGTAGVFGFFEMGKACAEIECFLHDFQAGKPLEIESIDLLVGKLDLDKDRHSKENSILLSNDDKIYILDNDPEFAQKLFGLLQYKNHEYEIVLFPFEQLSNLNGKNIILNKNLLTDQNIPNIHRLKKLHGNELKLCYLSDTDDFESRLLCAKHYCRNFILKDSDEHSILTLLTQTYSTQAQDPFKILIVDDDEGLAKSISQILEEQGVSSLTISDPALTIESIIAFSPDLLLFDMHMPHCSGNDLTKIIRQHEGYKNLPIVLMSTDGDLNHQVESRSYGVDDFILKPFEVENLIDVVINRAQRSREFHTQLNKDSLTKLFLKNKFYDYLDKYSQIAQRTLDDFSFAIIDLDNFRTVNDSYGYLTGDQVLVRFANFLRDQLRKSDIIGRYSGEEFVVIFPNTNVYDVEGLLIKLKDLFKQTSFQFNSSSFNVSFSAGISSYAQDKDIDELIDSAKTALIAAKKEGKDKIKIS